MSRERQGLPVSPYENAVTRAVVPPINAMLPGHALQLRNLPIQGVSPHGGQQLCGCVHGSHDTANEITLKWCAFHAFRNQPGENVFPLLVRQMGLPLPTPHGDWAMRMRFWSESTRGQEKLVRLSSRNFFGKSTVCPTRISPQSPVTLPNHRALRCVGWAQVVGGGQEFLTV